MIQIIKNIIIILVAVILLDKIFVYLFTEIVFKKTISGESGGTINYVINKKKKLDVLVIGPSRAKHGIDPKVLTSLGDDGYNLGINGTTILNSSLILDILIKNNVKIKTLVVATDLSDYASSSKEMTLDQIKRLYPYDTPLVREYVKSIGFVEQAKYFFDTYKFNRKILNITFNFLKKDSILDGSGYVGLPNTKYKPGVNYSSINYTYDHNSVNAESMRRIKKICDENGIKLIVVFSPSYNNVFFDKNKLFMRQYYHIFSKRLPDSIFRTQFFGIPNFPDNKS